MELEFRSIDPAPEQSTDVLIKENKHLRSTIRDLKRQVLELTAELESLRDENATLKQRLNVEIKKSLIS